VSETTIIKDPVISVQRKGFLGPNKQIGIFDGMDLVRPFETHTNEEQAIKEATAWLSGRITKEPRVVFPQIISMRASTSARRGAMRVLRGG